MINSMDVFIARNANRKYEIDEKMISEKNINNKSEKIKKDILGFIILISIFFTIIGFLFGYNIAKDEFYNKGLIEGSISYWNDFPDPENIDNYLLMRDVFTPMYDDTVTINYIDYKDAVYDWINNTKISDGGYIYWVNHTNMLYSFYYDDAMNYKVLIPTDGKIRVLDTNNMEPGE